MKSSGLLLLLCILPLLAGANQPQVIAYVFPQNRVLTPIEIAARKVTRINYAFANIRNGEIVEGFPHDAENFAVLNSLKTANPGLQILVSVGGWTWSGGFSDMALTPASRHKFVTSAVRFVEKYKLDGVDVDWEYPGAPGIGNRFRLEDSDNYTALMHDLRSTLDDAQQRWHRPLLTSVAAGANLDFLAHTNMRSVANLVDSVNLMSYDYSESSSSPLTGHHAPLLANPAAPKQISVDVSVRAFLAAGVPAPKLVLGVPFYGHAWADVSRTNNGLFQTGKPSNIQADYRTIAGSLLSSGYTRYWDPAACAPYLYNASKRVFISYEDPESVTLKANYALRHNLAGLMFWEYGGDFNGALLDAIDAAFGIKP